VNKKEEICKNVILSQPIRDPVTVIALIKKLNDEF
jgi:hypothetical protein